MKGVNFSMLYRFQVASYKKRIKKLISVENLSKTGSVDENVAKPAAVEVFRNGKESP